MRSFLLKVVFVELVAAAVWASLAWPHLARVETARTPEYPDLQAHEYGSSPAEVSRAVDVTIRTLGWAPVGGGKGAGGSQTMATARVLQIPFDVFIHVRTQKGR